MLLLVSFVICTRNVIFQMNGKKATRCAYIHGGRGAVGWMWETEGEGAPITQSFHLCMSSVHSIGTFASLRSFIYLLFALLPLLPKYAANATNASSIQFICRFHTFLATHNFWMPYIFFLFIRHSCRAFADAHDATGGKSNKNRYSSVFGMATVRWHLLC